MKPFAIIDFFHGINSFLRSEETSSTCDLCESLDSLLTDQCTVTTHKKRFYLRVTAYTAFTNGLVEFVGDHVISVVEM